MVLYAVGTTSAQSTAFSDDFSANTSATYTTAGVIGSSAWSIARSGNDWGGRRNNNILELSNDISATNNSNGWVFASVPSGNVSCYSFVLNNNSGPLTWSFNMRQSQADPGGFGNNTFGAAFVLAGTDASVATTGSGYAVVLGQSGSTDPVRLVHYNNGLRGTLTNIITSNTTGLTDFGTQYLSIRVVYNPLTDAWQLWLRNDGSSTFADPATGTLTSQGTATNSTYTNSSITAMGAYWQGGTTAGQSAAFDNVTLTKAISAPTIGTITHPTCGGATTGSVVLSGLPTTGNWLITRNPGGTTFAGTGSTTTVSGLAPNTYTFTVSDYSYGYQATVSACGYTATIMVEPLSIVSLDNPCTNGYNYNVEFNYTITVTGVNTCWDGEIGFQPQIFCNSQNNGNYTIRVPAPTVGAATSTKVYRGTITTQTRPWNPNTDCATATIVNQNCNRVDVTIFGPGIASETFPTTLATSSGCTSPASANVVINPAPAISITTQPSSISVCGNTTGSFTVAAAGTGSTYEWQRKTGSGSWAVIGTSAGATGSTTASLSIANLESNGWNNYLVRAVVNQSGCTATSDSALITISTEPTAPTSIISTSPIITSVAVVQSSAANTGSGNSITVNKPSGIQVGDLLLMGFTFEKGTGVAITPPADWTLIARTDQSTNLGMASYYRIATSADVVVSSYNFTVSNNPKWSIGIVRITGYNTANPIAGFNSQASSGSTTTVTAPTVTGAPANGLGIAFYANKKNATYVPANGTTEIYDSPNNSQSEPSNMMAYFTQSAAGSTSARNATASMAERWAAQQIVINPKQTIAECIGNAIVLTASGGSNGSGSYYQWGTGGVGNNILGTTGASVTVTALGSQQYWVRRVGNAGCTNATTAASANTEIRQPSTTINVYGTSIANGDYLWTGNSSLLWSTTGNWLRFDGNNYNIVSTLPTSTVNVFVVSPSDAMQCVANGNVTINNTNYSVRNISIGNNAEVWLAGSNNLNVTGNWANLGAFTGSGSTVTFNGTGTQTILSGLGASSSNSSKEFKHLTINKTSNSRLTLLDNLLVTGTLKVTLGELNVPVGIISKAEDIRIEPTGKLNLAGQLRLND